MWFVIAGLLLGALYLADIQPVAGWHWVWILLPWALAVAWWAFADSTGLTQRRAIEKMDKRKADRRQRDMEALGLKTPGARPARRPPADASQGADKSTDR